MNTRDVSINTPHYGAAPAGQRLALRIGRILDVLRVWHERARRRRELQEIPEHLLRDMGITREDVDREMDKPFWRP